MELGRPPLDADDTLSLTWVPDCIRGKSHRVYSYVPLYFLGTDAMWLRSCDFPMLMDMGQWPRISTSFLNSFSPGWFTIATGKETEMTGYQVIRLCPFTSRLVWVTAERDGIVSIKYPTLSKSDKVFNTAVLPLCPYNPAVSGTPENISRDEPMARWSWSITPSQKVQSENSHKFEYRFCLPHIKLFSFV